MLNKLNQLSVTIKFDKPRWLKGFAPVPDTVWHQIGQFALVRITDLTLAGLDYQGDPFKPYSPEYAKYREKHGHPTDHPDLKFHGKMQGAMTHEITSDNQVELFFMDAPDEDGVLPSEKALGMREQGREFFALSEATLDDIRDVFSDAMGRYYGHE